QQRNELRIGFIIHLIVYLGINAMLWGIWVNSGGGFPWPMFITLGWGSGLFAHAMQVYQSLPDVAARREEAIQREVEIEKRRMGTATDNYEKPKRDRNVRLSDDGELVPADEAEDDQVLHKAKRS